MAIHMIRVDRQRSLIGQYRVIFPAELLQHQAKIIARGSLFRLLAGNGGEMAGGIDRPPELPAHIAQAKPLPGIGWICGTRGFELPPFLIEGVGIGIHANT